MSDGSPNLHLPKLIRALFDANAYPHPVQAIELIETHISWVLLAGEYAYKIKKPLSLGFLDFRELDSRRFFCEEEIRLNRPWAPEIYLGVVKITRKHGRPVIEGDRTADGTAVEYAVKMKRFDQALRLDQQLQSGRLTAADMAELAVNIAGRHRAADVVPAESREHVLELTESLMQDNFAALRPGIDRRILSPLYEWTQCALQVLRPVIRERFDKGFFRDCHGDLHLANLLRLPSGITTFDCIEFSRDLRHIDVVCDVAFLVMDLESKGRGDLAAHFINRYLEQTDDYGGMRLSDLYFVYRSLVRAKVAVIRSGERDSPEARLKDLGEAVRYCEMATQRSQKRRPILIVMHGLSGSGKTWLAAELLARLPAVRIRSDLLRKLGSGLGETERSGSAIGEGIYTGATDAEVYASMRRRAAPVLQSGHNVILDATFLRVEYREKARQLAEESGAAFVIVRATAPVSELRRRIRTREQHAVDASEAGIAVLDHQLRSMDVLSEEEVHRSITIDSGDTEAVARLPDRVRRSAQNS